VDPIVTYQPGGHTSGTVFASFAALCHFIATNGTSTEQWTIQLDASQSAPLHQIVAIPAGTYVLPRSVTFVGLAFPGNGLYPRLQPANHVYFSPPPVQLVFDNLLSIDLVPTGSRAMINVTGSTGTMNLFFRNCGLVTNSGTQALVAVTNGAFLNMYLSDTAILHTQDGLPSEAIVHLDGSALASVYAWDTSQMIYPALVVDSGGTATLFFVDSASLDTQYLFQSPTYIIQFPSVAAQVYGVYSGTGAFIGHTGTSTVTGVILSGTSRVTATYNNVMGSTSSPCTPGFLTVVLRVPGDCSTPSACGSFHVNSYTAANTLNTGDCNSYDWHVVDIGV
jgi:hypothetical protein